MSHDTATMFQARPGYASGALCFAGTKVRVETLFNYLCDGGTVDEFSMSSRAWWSASRRCAPSKRRQGSSCNGTKTAGFVEGAS